MTLRRSTCFGFISALALGCGGRDGGGTGTGAGDSSGAGSASQSGSDEGSTAAGEGTGGASVGGSTGADADDGLGDGPVKLDVSAIPDSPNFGGNCGNGGKGGGGNGEPDFSYIWVANSIESTVSKINTVTLVEEGRYLTRADSNGNPSRTSVSLNGDVAVANRNGGVVKIYARHESCDDATNTSTGADDVKAFPDGCVAWYSPFNYISQRPVAWAPGDYDANACHWENEKLWTAGANNSIEVLLLDGDTGVMEQLVPIPESPANYFGIYGGAVDAEGNFWGTELGGPHLVYVDRLTFDHQVHNMPGVGGYGMTVDEQGRPWSCGSGVARFDPVNATWDSNPNSGGGGGCMVDGAGHLWLGGYHNQFVGGLMIGVNTETLDVDYNIPIPNYVHGVSVDFYGYVWGVTHSQTWAYKVDVENETYETFTGLNGPYTYSDMTGWALSNAVGPPPSG